MLGFVGFFPEARLFPSPPSIPPTPSPPAPKLRPCPVPVRQAHSISGQCVHNAQVYARCSWLGSWGFLLGSAVIGAPLALPSELCVGCRFLFRLLARDAFHLPPPPPPPQLAAGTSQFWKVARLGWDDEGEGFIGREIGGGEGASSVFAPSYFSGSRRGRGSGECGLGLKSFSPARLLAGPAEAAAAAVEFWPGVGGWLFFLGTLWAMWWGAALAGGALALYLWTFVGASLCFLAGGIAIFYRHFVLGL